MSKSLFVGLLCLGLLLGVGPLRAAAQHREAVHDFSMVGGLSPWIELGPVFQGTGNIADYDVTVENGYYFHDAGSPYHYLFFTARNIAVSPITYLVGYARAEHAYGPYKAVRRLSELEANGVSSLSNVCVTKQGDTYYIFHDSVLGYIGATPALIRYATTKDLDGMWQPQGIAFSQNEPGHFDDNYMIDTRVIWDGKQWRHYYTSPRNVFDTTRAQGCCLSDDLKTWRRFSNTPILDSDIEGLAIFPWGREWLLIGCGPSNTPGPVPFRTKVYASPDGLTNWRLLHTGNDWWGLDDPWPGTFNFNHGEQGLPFLIYSETGKAADDPQQMLLMLLATVPEPGAELLAAKARIDSRNPAISDTAEVLHDFRDGRVRFWVRFDEVGQGKYAQVFARRPALQDARGGNRGINFTLTEGQMAIGDATSSWASAPLNLQPNMWLGLELECRGDQLTFRAWDNRFLAVQQEVTVSNAEYAEGSLALAATNAQVEFARVELFD